MVIIIALMLLLATPATAGSRVYSKSTTYSTNPSGYGKTQHSFPVGAPVAGHWNSWSTYDQRKPLKPNKDHLYTTEDGQKILYGYPAERLGLE